MSKFLRPLIFSYEREINKLLSPSRLSSSREARLLQRCKCFSTQVVACNKRKDVTPLVTQQRLASAQAVPQALSIHADLLDDVRQLQLTWQNGVVSKYPYAWLRDSCRCPKCHLSTSKSRILSMHTWRFFTRPSDVQVDEAADELIVKWDDGHLSNYSLQWIRSKQFTEEARKERKKMLPLKPEMWGRREMQNNVPSDSFDNIMTKDSSLLNWIDNMEKTGLFLIKHTPEDVGQIRQFAKRIANLRRTNYDEEFQVKAKVAAKNHAYTSGTLGLHTDLADYQYTPGIQMLHCIKQVPTKGGENIFSDGFYVAELVRKLRPDLYKILTDITLEFRDIGEEDYQFHMIGRHRTITFNDFGDYEKITFNNQSRDYFLNVPLQQVNALYEALHFYNDLLYREDNHIKIKLQPGQIACFHNYRVLHGREAFQVLSEGERHLEGGFLDWDDVHSRRRMITYESNMAAK